MTITGAREVNAAAVAPLGSTDAADAVSAGLLIGAT